MKRFFYICAFFMTLTILAQAQQNNTGVVRASSGGNRTIQQQQAPNSTGSTELSVRAQAMNEKLTQDISNAKWIRNILREIDLTKEKNAPLNYPVQEMNGMKNLFHTLFQLVSEGKITAYKYQSEYDSFEADNILTFKEIINNFDIDKEVIPAAGGRPERYVVNSSDIPQVNRFFIKEVWYFDQKNSRYDVKTLAICPIANKYLNTGDVLQQPVFWVKYEDVRPYIINNRILTSNINNAMIYTMDDFFRRRMYDGEIIQTDNLMNLPLAALINLDEDGEEDGEGINIALVAEQQRIEEQLKAFNESLWIKPDTTAAVSNKRESKRVSSTRSPSNKDSAATKSASKEKAPKPTKAPAEKATKSAPTRSIRR